MITIYNILIREIVDNICNFLKLQDIVSFHNAFHYPLSNKWLLKYNKAYSKINNDYNNFTSYLISNIKFVNHECFYLSDICLNNCRNYVCGSCGFKCINCEFLICSKCFKKNINYYGNYTNNKNKYPIGLLCDSCIRR